MRARTPLVTSKSFTLVLPALLADRLSQGVQHQHIASPSFQFSSSLEHLMNLNLILSGMSSGA